MLLLSPKTISLPSLSNLKYNYLAAAIKFHTLKLCYAYKPIDHRARSAINYC